MWEAAESQSRAVVRRQGTLKRSFVPNRSSRNGQRRAVRKSFNVVQGREGTFIMGISMGGLGSLRMAVKYPEVFQAVASQEPAIEPALGPVDI